MQEAIKKRESLNLRLLEAARQDLSPAREDALSVLNEDKSDLQDLLRIAGEPRIRHFGTGVRIHILNNVQNGSCSEDCGYCAQRNDTGAERIPEYTMKPEEEILAEAEDAVKAGAYRYCMVLSGLGPDRKEIDQFARIVGILKERHPALELCLSAGVLTDPDAAEKLQKAGLDRYNHNLNTSIAHYDQICTTHEFQDRLRTVQTLTEAGVELCSGVIVGMGEGPEDLVDVAYRLRENRVASIPVNFFLPVPGHAIVHPGEITAERALRILILFRLVNPSAEIRMAAGREHYLGEVQKEAVQVANSLFVSGYLNVRGSNLPETLRIIQEAGMQVDTRYSDLPEILAENLRSYDSGEISEHFPGVRLKEENDLRPRKS